MAARAPRPGPPAGCPWPCRQDGVALLTALLVLAIASAAAVGMVWHQQFDIRRTENLMHAAQAWEHALGGEFWARGLLQEDASDDGSRMVDELQEDWAQPLPPTPIEGGVVAGRIFDLQARFNLNGLAPPAAGNDREQQDPVAALRLEAFRRLLALLELDPAAADAVVDWIDADGDARFPGGAEDAEYLAMDPPYRAANRPFAETGELRLVRGIDDKAFDLLAPLVSALPDAAATINVNTAPALVLRCIDGAIDEAVPEELVRRREEKPFANRDEFRQTVREILGSDQVLPADLDPLFDVKSEYFMVDSRVQYGRARLRLLSFLHRPGKDYPVTYMRRRELF